MKIQQNRWHVVTLAIGASACMALAEFGDQQMKLNSNDAASFDFFGAAVALDGDTAIVGAPWKKSCPGCVLLDGAAYLFDVSTGEEQFKLPLEIIGGGGGIGGAVSISGGYAMVGGLQLESVFVVDAKTGQSLRELTPSNPTAFESRFGTALGQDGTIGVVGAFSNRSIAQGPRDGSAFLFDVETGNELHLLMAEDPLANKRFGAAVAIQGSVVLVGAPGDNDACDTVEFCASGAAYVFDANTGDQTFKLVSEDIEPGDNFGNDVAVFGNIAVVGAFFDDDNGENSGSAYLFDTTTGDQLFKLLPDDGSEGDQFGFSVAINSSVAIVGAWHSDSIADNGGAAYAFDIHTGQQVAKLQSTDIDTDDIFGSAAAISGETAIIGAHNDSVDGVVLGSAYVFDLTHCPEDLNFDGTIDAADLGALIGQFGAPDSSADLNGDGVIDAADLGILIAAFGNTCP